MSQTPSEQLPIGAQAQQVIPQAQQLQDAACVTHICSHPAAGWCRVSLPMSA